MASTLTLALLVASKNRPDTRVVWLVPSTTAAIMQYGLDAQDRARRVRIGTSTPENGNDNGNGNGNGKRKGVSNTKIQPLHDGVLVVEY